MFKKNFPVLYKKNPATVTELQDEKITITFQAHPSNRSKKAQFESVKVREKDIFLLCEKECSSIENLLAFTDEKIDEQIKEAWLLLSGDAETLENSIDFEELAEILRTKLVPDESWFIYRKLSESVYFCPDEKGFKIGKLSFIPRTQNEIDEINRKNYEKEHQEEIRSAFIARLKERKLLPDDSMFMTEVENVALCKTEKSAIMREIGIPQSPENAHQLLLDTRIWDITKNPYPTRNSLSMNSATEGLGLPPDEERLEVPGISYAIDSPWSNDPDDAVAFDGKYLWIHIADPASSVLPESPIDIVARNKGTTLYLPEGAVRMLSETCFSDYALGLKEKSMALSFRIALGTDNTVEECKIFKTSVNVKRLTYEEATKQKESSELKPLFEIAQKNEERRKKNGATNIDMPEIHITVDSETKKVSISPLVRYEADSMVREMMLLAGEGAAHFAMNNRIPFPYISQEAPELPKEILPGLAGQFRLLKCMHKRSVGITPAMHSGLGIAVYSQVTSPLRRYGDLVAHQQLRAFLDGRKLIDKDDMLFRISQGDAASIASRKASRQSETHWKLIYLLQNPEWTGKAVCLDHKDGNAILMIPSLAMQTSINGFDELEPNEEVTLKPEKIDIPNQTCVFSVI
ncbi:MAG: ribonuclease catalytic domain-containing protein [Treponema sp.]